MNKVRQSRQRRQLCMAMAAIHETWTQ